MYIYHIKHIHCINIKTNIMQHLEFVEACVLSQQGLWHIWQPLFKHIWHFYILMFALKTAYQCICYMCLFEMRSLETMPLAAVNKTKSCVAIFARIWKYQSPLSTLSIFHVLHSMFFNAIIILTLPGHKTHAKLLWVICKF